MNNKKDKSLNTSVISFIIFLTVILANAIIYPLSITDNVQTSGMTWFFFVLLPSIPMFGISIILAIISICFFVSDKKKGLSISTFRTITNTINITQLIVVLATIIFLGIIWI